MTFRLRVIASVDENKRACPDLPSAGRVSSPASRPIVYVSREQCIQHKLRNAVLALTIPAAIAGSDPMLLYASVKVYSKESALFRKDACFPATLASETTGPALSWSVVVSNFLWWEIEQHHNQITRAPEGLRKDTGMPVERDPITMDANIVTKLGSVTAITVETQESSCATKARLNSAVIAQSLSGYVASLQGWLAFRSPHGSQIFKVTQIQTSGGDHKEVGIMSDTTVVKYASPSNTVPTKSAAPSYLRSRALISQMDWVTLVKDAIGGYDNMLSQIIDHMYGFIESAVHGVGNSGAVTRIAPGSKTCFQSPFKGIIISGRPGTGKSILASKLAEYSGLPYTTINCPDVFQTDAGASENYLRDAFGSLLSRGKASILILDEVDMIAGGRGSRKGVEAKLFATLLHLVDSINTDPTGSKIFVIALTNRVHAIDSSLTRSGRLDKVFDLHLKGADQRLQVLDIVSRDLPISTRERSNILRQVARSTHGFVPTDLQSLCTESALQLISRLSAGHKETMIDISYFEQALKTIRPSGMGEFMSKIPSVTFNDLFGIQDAIADLRVSIIEPFHSPSKYIEMGIAPPRGLLIHGPPGVGKTMLCCALAEELGINFMLVESSQIRSKVVGESEQNIARMFAQAKANAPCILFIDQIDVLAPSRGSTHTSENSGDRIVTGLLTEMDGFFSSSSGQGAEVDVLVLAATNRPEVIDSAILRPGRLDQIIHIPVPNQEARQAILEGYTSKMPLEISRQEMQQLAATTNGYSGADLENLCREAALICLREDINNVKITMSHLEAAKRVSKPSLLGYEDTHTYAR